MRRNESYFLRDEKKATKKILKNRHIARIESHLKYMLTDTEKRTIFNNCYGSSQRFLKKY
jgi:hypothetical protein